MGFEILTVTLSGKMPEDNKIKPMSVKNIQREIPNLPVYPIINIEIPKIPPRSYIYSMTPIGLGTPEVESLSSYISRIAQEYCVYPYKLAKNCVEKYSGSYRYLDSIGYNIFASKTINGFSEITKTIVYSIESATNRQDIRYTTLLPLGGILPARQLRHERAWCAACFQSDLKNGCPIYERLVWKINFVKICPLHEQELINLCPHCKKNQNNFSSYSFPGFCSLCKSWLGQKERQESKEELSSLNFPKEKWISSEIGKVLARLPQAEGINIRKTFVSSLESIMDLIPGFHSLNLYRQTKISYAELYGYLRGYQTISLYVPANISYLLKCSAADFLFGNKFTVSYKDERNGKKEKIQIDPSKYL